MRPIEHRADMAMTQALRCARYRIPSSAGLRPSGYAVAVGLRYGLIGLATAYHLLISANDEDEGTVLETLTAWESMVAGQIRGLVDRRTTPAELDTMPGRLGALAAEVVQALLPLYRRMFPLDLSLRVASDEFARAHSAEICAGWPLLARARAKREFRRVSDESIHFARLFFERRQAGLEEVREIALLGE